MKLSILICTVPSRVGNFLPAAVTELQRQIDSSGQGQVELIYLGDNKQRTVGRKRNDLLQLAQGEYVAFVDDDDRVAPNYISRILPQLDGTDVICFKVALTWNGQQMNLTHFDKDYLRNADYRDRYERLPNHVMVVRRVLALRTMYEDVSLHEDNEYSVRLKPLLKTQKKIDDVLYLYTFNVNTTETQQHLNPKNQENPK